MLLASAALRQQPQPQILRDVGVLVFVDQDVAEAAVVVGQHVGVVQEQRQAVQQQIAEIGGVQLLQAVLILRVDLHGAAVGEVAALGRRDLVGRQAAILPALDDAGEHAGRPALVVDAFGLQQLLQQADLVVGVEDGEIGLQPDQLGMAAQHARADGMEGAEPQPVGGAADLAADPLPHLARRLVGEGDGQDLAGKGPAGDAGYGRCGVVSTRVLPVPAPASTSSGPSICCTA